MPTEHAPPVEFVHEFRVLAALHGRRAEVQRLRAFAARDLAASDTLDVELLMEMYHRDVESSGTKRLVARDVALQRRRDRVIGHTILGAVAFTVFLAMLLIIGSLGTFVVAVAALFVGLRSFTFALSIALDDAWGWTRNGGVSVPLRWSDHVVLAGVGWLRRRSEAVIVEPTAGAIHVLPPERPS